MTTGFGLEKLGLVSLRFPKSSLAVVLIITGLMAYANSFLGFSSDIREIFRSGSPDFETLEDVGRQYPDSERDILMVVEGPQLFTADALERLRALHLDLSLTEGVSHVLSMFSARHPPGEDGQAAQPVVPPELAGADLQALKAELERHPAVSGKLLSGDGTLALFVLGISGGDADVDQLRVLIDRVRGTADEGLKDSGLHYNLTGVAVMRVEIIGALIRDQQKFRAAGLAVALLLCWLFFRNFAYVVIALAPAVVSIIWLKGAMGLAGQDINILTNIIPTLILVIAFASALHLLFVARASIGAGRTAEEAVEIAVREVGPACVLTSGTTALALLSLLIVPHPFIARFGLIGAFGVTVAFVAVMMTVPALCRLLLPRMGKAAGSWGKAAGLHSAIARFGNVAASWVRRWPGAIAGTGLAMTLLTGSLYALNEPHYQYQDNLPRNNPAFDAIETIDTRLAGSNVLRVLVQWPQARKPDPRELIAVAGRVHDVLVAEPKVQGVTSLKGVMEWFVSGGRRPEEMLPFLQKSASQVAGKLYSAEHNSVLVSGSFTSMPAIELVRLLDGLDAKLAEVRKDYPDVTIAATGLVPVSARAATVMIGQLNLSLLSAIVVVILLIGVGMQSLRAALVTIMPNLLPICVCGAVLYLTGRGLQFTSVVAFTVGFGIAVDSTIHVLNRYRLARAEGLDTPDALDATIRAIGGVLIISTLVLICGIGGTVFSELPMVQLYGQVIIVLLSAALAGALVLAPAVIRSLQAWWPEAGTGKAKKAKSRKAE
ncbi:MAG: RND family transporter [Hyphomicrobiales bacterium]